MDFIYRKHAIAENGKVDWIAYDTEFVDPLNDGITIYRRVDGSCFADGGHTIAN